MDYKPLSDRQKSVLDAILTQVNTFSRVPSIRELQQATGIASTRGVILQLNALEKAGYISRSKGARGIRVNQVLLDSSPHKTISIRRIPHIEETISIPLMSSSIPAGHASMADDHSEPITVSMKDTKGITNVFAVKVSGDSMIGANIEDGDTAIIASQPIANDGDIVAARTENGVTLKRFRLLDGRPILMPANPKYRPIVDDFEIQGKLINVLKNS